MNDHWTENQRPTLLTERLVLRPFHRGDAKNVQRLAGHPQVAATTATIPHPYPDGAAESWIEQHGPWFEQKKAVQFAITLKTTGELIGCIDFCRVSQSHSNAEMGYWIGVDFWNQGYCSEAVTALFKYGFDIMKLNKVTSRHLDFNPASGKVMMKAGMIKEGHLRKEYFKGGELRDLEIYGILRPEFTASDT